MPTKKTALVAGASGLIGSSLLNFLLESSRYETVIVMGRRAQALHHPKLQEYVFDFEEMAKYE
ncbi:MAG: NAD-dependent epimerase/dehydratase family protein, partial [Bacteroidia bacterium]|nr:NAD-dependent epimerase/dehydratase family protein [Bacteroidia bacterium]